MDKRYFNSYMVGSYLSGDRQYQPFWRLKMRRRDSSRNNRRFGTNRKTPIEERLQFSNTYDLIKHGAAINPSAHLPSAS
jgi:hypothetical protein